MLRVTIVLMGFAVFGALFAAAYYQPTQVERELPSPKFRLAPGEMVPDFIEPAGAGENISVNITVLTGGPIEVYLMNMENLTARALNGSTYSFELGPDVLYDLNLSKRNITDTYDFNFVADGQNRTALLIGSQQDLNESASAEEQTTEVAVTMRYTERETRSLVIGYILAAPSLALVGYVIYRRLRHGRAGKSGPP